MLVPKEHKTDGELKQGTKTLSLLSYVSKVSEATERLFRPLNVGVVHRLDATIRRLVMQPKVRLPPADTSGVICRVNCLDCRDNYCGITDKRLRTRMNQHTLALRRKDARSHFVMHSLENNHWFDFDGAQVLGRAKKDWRAKSSKLGSQKPNLSNAALTYQCPMRPSSIIGAREVDR
ncbi:unnamed protein product [Schistocephalus solidus]|uniref:Uncharacterized protein n=1 Tax=Schistocephalus solidus TaxID=70667 RepID=A0A183TC71_SCHSO|nr:unnamed protein product [Schistocephalus solidus]